LVESAKKAAAGMDEGLDFVELRRFCTARLGKIPSPKSVSHNLQAIADAPVLVMAGSVSLKTYVTRDKQRRFYVELKKGNG
jgi:hypothetical protein